MNPYEPEESDQNGMAGMADTAREMAGNARHTMDDALAASEEYVRNNPVPVVLGALAVGFALGVLLGRRDEPTARERYVDEPIGHARDVLYSLFAPVAEKLQARYASAESAADRFAHHDAPGLFKEARRVGEKLKFW